MLKHCKCLNQPDYICKKSQEKRLITKEQTHGSALTSKKLL